MIIIQMLTVFYLNCKLKRWLSTFVVKKVVLILTFYLWFLFYLSLKP